MIEKKFLVKPYVLKYFCEDCDVELEATGVCYPSFPAQYEYKCPQCGKKHITTNYEPAEFEVIEEIKNV